MFKCLNATNEPCSIYSREAPPPVEIWPIQLDSPDLFTALTESPPPTKTKTTAIFRKAFSNGKVPFEKLSFSNRPHQVHSKELFWPSSKFLKT